MIYSITPVPAPRMTRSDKWNKRPCVLRYFAFRDEIKLKKVTYESGQHVVFHIPMPDSWSKKKKAEMEGKPHMQVPDCDNFFKGMTDSIFDDDSHIWKISAEKRWSVIGQIAIY